MNYWIYMKNISEQDGRLMVEEKSFDSYDAEIREAVLDIWTKFLRAINEYFPNKSSKFLLTHSNDFDGLTPFDTLNPSDYFINYVDEELGFEMETYLDALVTYISENL